MGDPVAFAVAVAEAAHLHGAYPEVAVTVTRAVEVLVEGDGG